MDSDTPTRGGVGGLRESEANLVFLSFRYIQRCAIYATYLLYLLYLLKGFPLRNPGYRAVRWPQAYPTRTRDLNILGHGLWPRLMAICRWPLAIGLWR